MINLKSQKGAITLFVLVSCMFFVASVVCVEMYIQSKKIAVDREYRQIKQNYENSINNDDSEEEIDNQIDLNNIAEQRNYLNGNILVGSAKINKKEKNTIKYQIIEADQEIDNINDIDLNECKKWQYIDKKSDIVNYKIEEYNENIFYYIITVIDNNQQIVKMDKPLLEITINEKDNLSNGLYSKDGNTLILSENSTCASLNIINLNKDEKYIVTLNNKNYIFNLWLLDDDSTLMDTSDKGWIDDNMYFIEDVSKVTFSFKHRDNQQLTDDMKQEITDDMKQEITESFKISELAEDNKLENDIKENITFNEEKTRCYTQELVVDNTKDYYICMDGLNYYMQIFLGNDNENYLDTDWIIDKNNRKYSFSGYSLIKLNFKYDSEESVEFSDKEIEELKNSIKVYSK